MVSTAPKLQMIPLADLIPSPDNPRVIRVGDSAMQELAASIKERGVLEPVLARPHPKKKGKFDLRAGARRHAAAKIAKLSTIPTIVREMDDAEALEVTVTENLQREDLTPLEESRGVQALLAGGWEAKAIAAHLGKRPEWVVRRAHLTKLTKAWLKEVEGKDGRARNWSAAHLELIARLEPKTQDQALEILEGDGDLSDREEDDVPTLSSVSRSIGHLTRELAKALWKKDDTTLLPKVGACIECQKRSSATPGLFDDFDAPPEQLKKGDRCLDPKCWEEKASAHTQRVCEETKKKHGDVLLIATDYQDHKGEKCLKSWEVTRCKKTDKDAKPCVVLYGDDQGQTFWGRTQKEARASSSSGAKESSSSSGIPDNHERKEIAEAFALAHTAWVYTNRVFATAVTSEKFELIQKIVNDLVGEGTCGRSRAAEVARQWLAEKRPEKEEKDEYLAKAAALAICDLAKDPKRPLSDQRSMAAKTFVIPECFLETHLRANIARIAMDLNVEVKSGASKAELVNAILNAKLPAGTLTKELKKAFGLEETE